MITWRASALISALAACTGAALALAVMTGRWQLVVFAAPFVGALAGASRRPPAARAWVTDEPEPLRCLESETITVAVSVESTGPAVVCGLRPALVEGLRIDADRPAAPNQLTMRTSAQRWGRYRVPVEVRSVSASGLWAGTALTLPASELRVYPLADPQDVALPPADLPDRIGTRLTRHHGPGRRVRGHPRVRTGRLAAHRQLAGECATGTLTCHRPAHRSSRRCCRTHRHVPAAVRPGDHRDRAIGTGSGPAGAVGVAAG